MKNLQIHINIYFHKKKGETNYEFQIKTTE